MLDDKCIIKLFLNRIESAIHETKIKYGRLIISIAYHILQNIPDAEESENDTYLGLWNSIPPHNPENFKAYTMKIARNSALKKYEYNHAGKRDVSKTVSYDKPRKVCEAEVCKLDDFNETEIADIINEFLEGLKPDCRKVFMLRYWYVMSVKEIMKECGMSKSKVESILFRTRKQLKDVLVERRFVHEGYAVMQGNESGR